MEVVSTWHAAKQIKSHNDDDDDDDPTMLQWVVDHQKKNSFVSLVPILTIAFGPLVMTIMVTSMDLVAVGVVGELSEPWLRQINSDDNME